LRRLRTKMAISDSQKVDLLLKKLGYGLAKTDTGTVKSPSNESIASPLLVRGDLIWVDADKITEIPPTGSNTTIQVRIGSSSVECVPDITSTTNRTWLTNFTDWITPEFGTGYQIRVWTAPANTMNPTTNGTRLFPDGSGNNDSWYFDYQAGVLNFPDTNVPSSVTGNRVYIEGYRYIGLKGFDAGASQGFVNKGSDPSNWDTNTTFGLYSVNRISWSGTVGTPNEAESVGLLTVFVSENTVVQKYQPNDTTSLYGAEFVRIKISTNDWSDWTRMVGETGLVDGGTF
jgi:hypothetical protein